MVKINIHKLCIYLGLIAALMSGCAMETTPTPTFTATSKRTVKKTSKPKPTKKKTRKPEPSATVEAESEHLAVRDLKAGWSEELIYQNDLVSPDALTLDGKGNLLIFDHCHKEIFRLNAEGEISKITKNNPIPVRTMAWQPNRGRLIAVAAGMLFELSGDKLELINEFEGVQTPSTIAVDPEDDSFYGCSESNDQPINHYGPNGEKLETLEPSAGGCYQIAYDPQSKKVFYSETFKGQVVEIDLSSGESKVLAQEVGIPGTIEGISVALDEKGDLYFYDVYNGLNRYQDGQFVQVMAPATGIGIFLFSPSHKGFVTSAGAGGNLALYNLVDSEVYELTPHLNSIAVVEMDSGEVLIADNNMLMEVTKSGITPIGEAFPEFIMSMVKDKDGNIYIGLVNGRIFRYSGDGSIFDWGNLQPQNNLVYLSYDPANNTLVATTENQPQDTTTIWRVPVEDPSGDEEVIVLENRNSIAAADNQGNIYVLEGRERLYQIDSEQGEATLFATSELPEGEIDLRSPNFVYSSIENGFVVGSNEFYALWSLETGEKTNLAMNQCGADNFAIHETKEGDLICVHSGQVFRLKYEPEE
ncbi:MAG: hypothetical protein ACK2U3_04020 [Anaerolineales bacterium]